jgi:hypothetical protein
MCPLEVEHPDDLANLPPDQVVSGEHLKMKPGQTLAQKARELGVTQPTLRLWHVEWRGSGYDPEYRRIAPLHHDMFGGFVVRE